MKLGFVVVLADTPDIGHQPRYAEVREVALRAEAAGFDSIWLYDHLLYHFPGRPTTGIWECCSVLAALAEATNRVEIGTLVTAPSPQAAAASAWRPVADDDEVQDLP